MKKHVVSTNKYIFYFLELTLKNTMIFMSSKVKNVGFKRKPKVSMFMNLKSNKQGYLLLYF
jgi:hypothetical protein